MRDEADELAILQLLQAYGDGRLCHYGASHCHIPTSTRLIIVDKWW